MNSTPIIGSPCDYSTAEAACRAWRVLRRGLKPAAGDVLGLYTAWDYTLHGITHWRTGLRRVLNQRARRRAVFEAFAATGALCRVHLVEMSRFQVLLRNRRLRTYFAAQSA